MLKSIIYNEKHGPNNIFIDNRYVTLQLLTIIHTAWNIRDVGIRKYNIKDLI